MPNLFKDPLMLVMIVVLVVLVIFMFRNNRKRQKDQEERKSKFVPGTRIMTTAGIFATIVSVDNEKGRAILETMPGVQFEVLLQAIARIESEMPGEKVNGAAVPAGTEQATTASTGESTSLTETRSADETSAHPNGGVTLNGEPLDEDKTDR